MEILRLVAKEPVAGIRGIAKRLGMPKSTAHRLMATLQETGLLQRVASNDSATFVLGPLLTEFAGGFTTRQRLGQVARPLMQRLRDKCDETVLLHVFDGSTRIVIEQVESTQQLRRTYTNLGMPVPIYGGAASKVFLASLPEAELRHYWKTFPPARTASRRAFERFIVERRTIARQGYAVSFAEITPGVASIAMPITSPDGRVIAAISVTGPLSRLSLTALKEIRPPLAETVREIALALPGAQPAVKGTRQ